MRYLLLIYDNADSAAAPDDSEPAALVAGHAAVYRELADAGMLLGSAALARPSAAATVRVRDGAPAVTDGPFLETKEHLAGFYLVECADIEQAAGIAARIPCGAAGAVEIRLVDETVTNAVRGENP